MTLAKAFAGIKETRQPGIQLAGNARTGKTVKSSDPDFRQTNVYLRKATVKAAQRKWEDEGRGDFSDLVERLLADYLAS